MSKNLKARGVNTYTAIRTYLLKNSIQILNLATKHHKELLSDANYRYPFIEKNRPNHLKVIRTLAKHLEARDVKRGSEQFRHLGMVLAKDAVKNKLHIEEAVNGIMFLEQAIWDTLYEEGLLNLPHSDYYYFTRTSATYCDVVASKIAFTYHNEFNKSYTSELDARIEAESIMHSEQQYAENIFETIREPLIVLDQELRLVSANSAFYKKFKVTKKQSIGKLIYRLGNGQWNIPKLRLLLEDILPHSSHLDNFEVEHEFEDIGKKVMLLNARRVDHVKLILLAIEDITDRTVKERELQTSEAKYRILVEGVKDYAIIIIDYDGKIASWNRGAQRILGYHTKEAIGRHFEIFRTDEDRHKSATQELETVQKFGQYHEIGLRKKKDGTVFWADILTTKVYDNGHLRGFAKIIRDISKQKSAEDNLKFLSEASRMLASSLDYKTTLDNIGQLAVPKIADWFSVEMLNHKGEFELLTLVHKNPDKVRWAIEYRANNPPSKTSKTGLAHVINTGKPELYPHVTDDMLRRSTKNPKDYDVTKSLGICSAMIVPIFQGKKTIGAITLVSAETKRHYDRKDLSMAQELATRASAALENAELYRVSQEAVSIRDNFISVASHELKTPVTSIKIFTQVLKKHESETGDTKAIEYLSKMENQIDKLTELIYDLLNVAKIQAGRLTFKNDQFDFDSAILEEIDVLQQTSPHHKIVVNGRTGVTIRGDKERIGQVVNNLVSNATKYSPRANSILISLSKSNGQVFLSVQDYGVGIPQEHLSKIFDRFYRVYDTADKTYPGLGLGLYISSEIIKRHYGKLWVDSKPGKGSIFTFSLPTNKSL